MENKEFKKAAIKYFEGKNSSEEEKVLLYFIKTSASNKDLYDKWEKEWIESHQISEQGQREWEEFQKKIKSETTQTVSKKTNYYSLFKHRIAVAACFFILGGGLMYAISSMISRYVSDNVFYVEAPKGEKSKVKLPDGTIVWLNAGSVLSYNGNFNAKDRTVKLLGEGFFEVNKNGNIPFTVQTSKYNIIVKGTKFNISSYSDDSYITTSLIEGEVELLYKEEIFKIKSGEIIQLDIDKDTLIKSSGRINQFKSWTENKIEYDAIGLSELMKRLSRQYDVNIFLEGSGFNEKVLSVSLNNREPIEEIMKGIAKIIPVSIYYEGKDIYVREK